MSSRSDHKYGAKKAYADGHTFDSIAERDRYLDLKLLERAGKIADLELQPKFWLTCGGKPVLIKSEGYPNGRRASYRADFRYLDLEKGETIVEDVKGLDTSESRLRRAMVEAEHGVTVVLIQGKKARKRTRFRPNRRRN